jgi:hypothetical protein
MGTVMQLDPSEHQPDLPHSRIIVGSSGVLVSRDLIFVTKIKATAASLGYAMLVAGTQPEAESMITTYRPPVVMVDLTAGEMAASTALKAYRELASVDTWLIAFGPHIDTDALAAAKTAGFHVVLPRSQFTTKLPELLRQYFSHASEKNG